MSCIWTFVCHDHSGKFHSWSSSYFIYTFRQGVTCTTCSKQHFSSCVPSSSLFHLFASVWRTRTYQLVFSPLFIVWHLTCLLRKSTGVYLWDFTSSNCTLYLFALFCWKLTFRNGKFQKSSDFVQELLEVPVFWKRASVNQTIVVERIIIILEL